MVTLYWVYDLPNWLFGVLCIGTFVAFGLVGMQLSRNFARRVHREDHSHNDIVGYYLAAVTVFYGITLGLVAVGTWNNHAAVQDRVDHERRPSPPLSCEPALFAQYRDRSQSWIERILTLRQRHRYCWQSHIKASCAYA